jgi:hypothetical protein
LMEFLGIFKKKWICNTYKKHFCFTKGFYGHAPYTIKSHFQTVYEGEFWCLCTVTLEQNGPKLNSRPVYYSSRLYGKSLFCHKSRGWGSMGAAGAKASTKFENWLLAPINCQLVSSLKFTASYVSTYELKFLMQLWKCTWQI